MSDVFAGASALLACGRPALLDGWYFSYNGLQRQDDVEDVDRSIADYVSEYLLKSRWINLSNNDLKLDNGVEDVHYAIAVLVATNSHEQHRRNQL